MTRKTLLIGGPFDGVVLSTADGADIITMVDKPQELWWPGFPDHTRHVIGPTVDHDYRIMLVTATTKVMAHESLSHSDVYDRLINLYPERRTI